MDFEVIKDVKDIETIAIGSSICELQNLNELFGGARWKKRKGIAEVRLPSRNIRLA